MARTYAELKLFYPNITLDEFKEVAISTANQPINFAEKKMLILNPQKLSDKLSIKITDDRRTSSIFEYDLCLMIYKNIKVTLCGIIFNPYYYIPAAIIIGICRNPINSLTDKYINPIITEILWLHIRSFMPYQFSVAEELAAAFMEHYLKFRSQQLISDTPEEKENRRKAIISGITNIVPKSVNLGVKKYVPAQIYNFFAGGLKSVSQNIGGVSGIKEILQSPGSVKKFCHNISTRFTLKSITNFFLAGTKNCYEHITMENIVRKCELQYEQDWETYIATTRTRWLHYLENNPNIQQADDEQQRIAYEQWVKHGIKKYSDDTNTAKSFIAPLSYDAINRGFSAPKKNL